MKALPENIRPFSRTPVFTQDNIPDGLLENHATAENVWGLIQVRTGSLEYTIDGEKSYILTPGNNGVIEPQVTHHIKPLGLVSFFVRFFR